MLIYHLRRVPLPRWLVVIGVVAWVWWIGFRPGGTEVGYEFGTRAVTRLWAVVTPILVVVVIPMLGRLWRTDRLRQAWLLSQPSLRRAAYDTVGNFLAGYLVFAAFVGVVALVAVAELDTAQLGYADLAIATAVGPMLGAYAVLALGYLIGAATGSAAIRIATVVVAAVLDATNQIPAAWLSLSGLSRTVSRAGVWHPGLQRPTGGQTLLPTLDFLVTRLVMCLVLTIAIALFAAVQARRTVSGGETG